MPSGSSTVRERQPGVWEVRVYKGRDANGKVKHVSRTIHGGKRKAEDARRKLIAEVREGQHRASRGTVSHLLGLHLSMLERKGTSPSTLRSYRSYIRANIAPAIGDLAIEDLTPKRLDDLYEDLGKKELKDSTVHQHHAIISGALRQAVKWGWLPANVAERATPPSVEHSEVTAPTIEQVQALVALAKKRNPILAAFLVVAATTGARRGELCALRWRNVNLDDGWALISENVVEAGAGKLVTKDTKSHKAGRIALDPFTLAVLDDHRARVLATANDGGRAFGPDAFVFSRDVDGSRPYTPTLVTGFFTRLRGDAGCPTMRLHHLRHFMATQAIASGADVRTVAGRLRHDANMTLRVYSHLLEERDRGVANHMGELFAPKE